MIISNRIVLVSLFLFFVSVAAVAQPAADPSGHWEGTIHAGTKDVAIEVDLAKRAKGDLAGTFGNPAESVHGFPLSNVKAEETSVTFEIKANGGGVFHGTLAADGKTMKGNFSMIEGSSPIELPFELNRTGPARIEAAPKSAAISKDLEGAWTGTMDVDGKPFQLGLRLNNQSDGSADGVVISREGVEVPITRISQSGSSVTVEVKTVGGSFAGTLGKGGAELEGSWRQGAFVAPITFRHRAASGCAVSGGDAVDRWASAVGGREKVAAIRSLYREATMELGGVKGTIKVWRTPDGKYRKEEQIATYSTIETFDGVAGILQEGDGPAHAMTGPELQRAKSTGFANWSAVFFAFFPERRHGTVTIEGNNTVVLRAEGGIDWSVTLDPQTSLPATMIHKQGDRTITVTFVSYETVDGIRIEKEIHRTTGDPRYDAVIRFTKTATNVPVDAALFSIDSKKVAEVR